jgi:hypothetical protein
MKNALDIRPRKPTTPKPDGSAFREAATMAGPNPLDFLRSVMDGKPVEIGGEQYKPTRAEQQQAAAYFAAVLMGRRDEESDDFYNEKGEA